MIVFACVSLCICARAFVCVGVYPCASFCVCILLCVRAFLCSQYHFCVCARARCRRVPTASPSQGISMIFSLRYMHTRAHTHKHAEIKNK